MLDKQRLTESLTRLQGEQAALQGEIAALRAELVTIATERQAAQKRYDTGHDSAAQDVERLTNERDATEAAIGKLERSTAEYPDRIAHVQREIGIATHREKLQELLTLRKAELEAFDMFEAATFDFLQAHEQMHNAHIARKALASSLEQSARAYGLGNFDRGDVVIPSATRIAEWLESANGVVMAEQAFTKARSAWPVVEG